MDIRKEIALQELFKTLAPRIEQNRIESQAWRDKRNTAYALLPLEIQKQYQRFEDNYWIVEKLPGLRQAQQSYIDHERDQMSLGFFGYVMNEVFRDILMLESNGTYFETIEGHVREELWQRVFGSAESVSQYGGVISERISTLSTQRISDWRERLFERLSPEIKDRVNALQKLSSQPTFDEKEVVQLCVLSDAALAKYETDFLDSNLQRKLEQLVAAELLANGLNGEKEFIQTSSAGDSILAGSATRENVVNESKQLKPFGRGELVALIKKFASEEKCPMGETVKSKTTLAWTVRLREQGWNANHESVRSATRRAGYYSEKKM